MSEMRRDVPLRTGWPGAGLALSREVGVRGETARAAAPEARGRPGARHFPGGPEVSNDRDVVSIDRCGDKAEDSREETGSVAQPMGGLGASLTPRPRFDRKANHRRYMREWRRRRRTLRMS